MLMLIPKLTAQVEKGFSNQIILAETQIEEPTSPKISCMGRIKHKERQRINKKLIECPKTKTSPLRAFFSRPQEKISGAPRPLPKVPHIRKSAHVHDKLAGFDWRAQVSHSEGENEIKIPFSAPIIVGQLGTCEKINIELKPRKEINLWKRRTMAQPRPLQVAPLN